MEKKFRNTIHPGPVHSPKIAGGSHIFPPLLIIEQHIKSGKATNRNTSCQIISLKQK